MTDGSNSKVGAITGLNGLAMVAVAPLCGWWADKHRRDRMLRVAGVVGVLMAIATMIGVVEGHYPLLCASLVGWGVYSGIQSPAMEALFADSVEPGERSRVFTTKYGLSQLASAAGPLCCIVMFSFLGNAWEVPQCQHVIMAGLLLCLFPSILCYLFDDDKTLLSHSPQSADRRRREHEEKLLIARQASAGNDEAQSKALIVPLLSAAPDGAGMVMAVVAQDEEQEEAGPSGRSGGCCAGSSGWCAQNYIPTVIVATDICFALASGMSIKFFPIMFQESTYDLISRNTARSERCGSSVWPIYITHNTHDPRTTQYNTAYKLSPMIVSMIYAFSPLATAVSSFVAQWASRRLGRVATTIAFKVVS